MTANPDPDDMQRRRRTGWVVSLAAAGMLIAAVLLAPLYQEDTPAKLATAKRAASAAETRPHEPRLHDEEFSRLTAADAPLAATYKAYGWVKECLYEREFAAQKITYRPRCGLSDGNVDDVELRKQLVTRLALAGSFGAITDVHQEGPNGTFKAFADDPKGHARLLDEAYAVGLAKAEPAVLAGEAVDRQLKGDLLRAVGATDAARAEYFKSLAYGVASVAGLAKQNGEPFAGRDDPKVHQALSESGDRLAPQDRDAAIAEGERIAAGWRPF